MPTLLPRILQFVQLHHSDVTMFPDLTNYPCEYSVIVTNKNDKDGKNDINKSCCNKLDKNIWAFDFSP